MLVNTHTAVYSCLWMFPGWLGSDKSSTSAPRCRKYALGKGAFRARSPHHLPKPVDYAHQTTCSSQHHTFYPTIGGWARQSKAPLPIEMASFSKVQIERGAFNLHVLSACAVRRCHVPLHSSLQHHIIMMHVTSRVIWNRNLSSRQP